MALSRQLNDRARDIGCEIFESAGAAAPRVWQQAWWLEGLTRAIDADERIKTRAFQFVDCLPSLRSVAAIVAHLRAYFHRDIGPLGRVADALLRPGPLAAVRDRAVAAVARFGATRMAGRFIAGCDPRDAITTIERLRARGMACTLDVLGESTISDAQADRYLQAYLDLIDAVADAARRWPRRPVIDDDAHGPMPRVNVSIKLTGLDPHLDPIDPKRSIRVAGERLRRLLRRARRAGALVNIDMESSRYRALTLELFKTIFMEPEFRDWADVGIVVQAYLVHGERDLADLLAWGRCRGTRFTIRLVKGAYWDAETAAAVCAHKPPPVWTDKWASDACYERMTRTLLDHADLVRPAFASHNVRSLAVVLATAEACGVAPNQYEVQMLYGMGDPLKTAMVRLGRCVRVYAPVGDFMPGMAYLIRRLLENTSNDSFLKQGFGERHLHDKLLADPDLARPPSSPLPRRHYENTDPEEPMSTFTNASHTDFADETARTKMAGAIKYVRGALDRAYPLIINGRRVTTETSCISHNPSAPSEVIGRVALAGAADADRAVAAARKAFPEWRRTVAAERAGLLRQAADRMEVFRFELAATMILESGKPWREGDADVTEAIDHCRFYADQIERIDTHPRRRDVPGEANTLCYTPKGVCVVISPWTFPLAILTGMTSAALAAGNTVVIKPARQAAVVAARLVEILHGVGFPPGVVHYLPAEGASVGAHLVEHGDVNLVAFTGSCAVGADVIRTGATVRPGQSFIKKMIVEMGGKNAIIVDDDADVEGAVQAVVESAYSYAGQKCSSCSRVITLPDVHDAFCDRLVDATRSVVIGPADAPATFVGPVIDAAARDRINAYIDIGRDEARLLVQAELPPECGDGYFVPPTVFVDAEPTARIAQEEIFGPVLTVLRAVDFDDALDIANGTRYALTGGVFSRNPGHIDLARHAFAVGNLYINRKITGSQVDAQPFGGFRLSGTGVKAGSWDYLLHFMDARCITENTLRSGFVPSATHLEVS
ncbi:MAG: proline dehydrogenase family protein [Phycisphaerae bacterium]